VSFLSFASRFHGISQVSDNKRSIFLTISYHRNQLKKSGVPVKFYLLTNLAFHPVTTQVVPTTEMTISRDEIDATAAMPRGIGPPTPQSLMGRGRAVHEPECGRARVTSARQIDMIRLETWSWNLETFFHPFHAFF